MNGKLKLIFVDCEAWGGCPAVGRLTEFGAVDYASRQTFHGVIVRSEPSDENPAIPKRVQIGDEEYRARTHQVFRAFEIWLQDLGGPWKFVSDNPAFDWQWINHGFWTTLGYNPFGHSARRIGDFYCGLLGNFYAESRWKRLRVTPHDHHPVHDAQGNVDAFERMLKGERG